MATETASSALSGIKVLDLAALFPAPLLAAMMGDYGADVVKVEPPHGDGLRGVGAPTSGNSSTAWSLAGRNKRSVALDLNGRRGLKILADLTAVADVIVTNQSRKQLQIWSCAPEQIAARNPGAVVVSLTGFGSTGPLRDTGANGTIAEAFSGVADLTGQTQGPPTLPSFALGDTLAAISALNGVLAALYWRDANGGRGQFIDASLYEPLIGLLASTYAGWNDNDPPPTRNGSRLALAAPRNLYQSADGSWVALSATTDAQVARVFDLISTDSTTRTRYATSHNRVGIAADNLDAAVAEWIASLPLAVVVARCDAARIPVARVHSMDEVMQHPHTMHRQNFIPLSTDDHPVRVPAPTPRLSATPSRFHRAAPKIGEHTDDVLRDWLSRDNAADRT